MVVIIQSHLTTALGILQHAWRTKRVLLGEAQESTDPNMDSYLEAKQAAVHNSLRRWREGWPETLSDYEHFQSAPALYQDRAEACWYLAGIIILPRIPISSPKVPASAVGDALTIQESLERLSILSDQIQLHATGHDFKSTYALVVNQQYARTGALASLMYREPDKAMAGFND